MAVSHSFAGRERNHWMVPLAAVTAVVILALWFPLGALVRQQSELAATNAQISALRQQENAIDAQQHAVSSATAAMDRAREQYQLVQKGQSLIQVLPGRAAGQVSSSIGDPGLQPLAAPFSLSPVATGATSAPSGHHSAFLARLLRTLEFWR